MVLPASSLILSSILGFICIYIFTIFGFYFFDTFYNRDQSVDECSNLLVCLITFLHEGLLNGGGIKDHVEGDLGIELPYNDSTSVIPLLFFIL